MSEIRPDVAMSLSSMGNAARIAAFEPGLAARSRFVTRLLAVLAFDNAMVRLIAGFLSVNLVSRFLSGLSILASVWLFAPAEFVRFGALLAALTLASPMQFLRYEATIVSARGEAELRTALRLTAMVGLGVWAVMAVCAWGAVSLSLVGRDMAWLFLGALAGRGICRMVGRIGVRNGHFSLLGQSSLAFSAVQPVVIVAAFALGVNGAIAMALTDIIGNITAGACLVWHCRHVLRDACRVRPGDVGLVAMARAWSSLPLVNLPSTVLAAAFTSVPLLVVLGLADMQVAGHVALAFRLLDVPAQILASAISPIAMNRFTAKNSMASRSHDPALVFWLIVAVSAAFGAISLGAIMIEPWLLGTSWQGVSAFIPLVALFQGGVALALPLIEVAGMRRNQRDLFIIQCFAMLCVGALALVAGHWHMALLGFGLISALRASCLMVPLLWWHEPRVTV